MSIGTIFHLVSNYCQVIQLERNECTKSVVVFCDWRNDHTRENTETVIFFFGRGKGVGVNFQSPQTSCYLQSKVQEYTVA